VSGVPVPDSGPGRQNGRDALRQRQQVCVQRQQHEQDEGHWLALATGHFEDVQKRSWDCVHQRCFRAVYKPERV
jgi:hypothetical protein